MGTSSENTTAQEDTGAVERHPCLSDDFDQRLAVARKQRAKVLAERAAAAAATGEAPSLTATTREQPAWNTSATQDVPQTGTHPGHVPVISAPRLYRNPKSTPKDVEKKPWPVTGQLRWIATAALAGMVVGSVGTVIFLESRSTGYETDIVSRAASQPDASWAAPPRSIARNVSMAPDRSLRLAGPRTDSAVNKSAATAIILRPSPDTSSPGAAVRILQPAAPVVQLSTPNLSADSSGESVGVLVSQVAEPQGMVRVEPPRQPQDPVSDSKPSVDLGSLAPTLANWDVVMTAPRQDQPGQVSPPFPEWSDSVTHQPVLEWPAPKDDFNCQDCQMTALPMEDQTVILFVSDTSSTQQRDMMSRLSSLGLAHVELHQIRLGASETNVRYFHASDAAAARAVAQSVKARLVNLSALRPLPPVGTIELRLGPDRPDIAKSSQISSDIKG